MKTTERGIRYISLIEEDSEFNIQAMVKKAKTAYKPFNFKDKIELLVFYSERKDFSHTIFTEYGIIDDEFDGKKAIHHPFGVKSIIGIELSGDDPVPLIAFALGQGIEHFKQNLDIQRHAKWRELEKSEAYLCWEIFFCQVHSATIRYENDGAADLFLRSLPFLLTKKEQSFSASYIDGTFRHLINALSELHVLKQAGELEKAEDHLQTFRELTDESFIELYQKLFEELVAYLTTVGTKYNEVHELTLFKNLETHKKQLNAMFS
ncbi:hypothetical protein [Planococcus sp. ISL-109]|uniref:hypothetical protein n=1 Tax=Planococcus sp. ISL-109 TaxID=2819166 RepID=UPI001BE6E651|nr:hypothetical protein [Planococcus sp. ISL-109]MBT2582151.1 hypothetical protein [Planococcus sp. ISL-109]